MDQQILIALLAGASALAGLSVYGIKKLAEYIDSKTENQMLEDVTWQISKMAGVAIDFVDATFAEELKAKAEDGKLTADEGKEAAKRALDVIKAGIGSKLWAAGTGSKAKVDIELMAKAEIESAIKAVKASKKNS